MKAKALVCAGVLATVALCLALWSPWSGTSFDADMAAKGPATGELLDAAGAPSLAAHPRSEPRGTPSEPSDVGALPPTDADVPASRVRLRGIVRMSDGSALPPLELYLQRKGIGPRERDRGSQRIDIPMSPGGTFDVEVDDPRDDWLLAKPVRQGTWRYVPAFLDGAHIESGQDLELVVRPGRRLRVEVIDERGRAATGAGIMVSPLAADHQRVWPDPGSAPFGSMGKSMGAEQNVLDFAIPDDGPLLVRATKQGYARAFRRVPAHEDHVVVQLAPVRGRIRVVLANPDAFPHASASVYYEVPGLPDAAQRVAWAQLQDGVAVMDGLSGPGRYAVSLWATDAEPARVDDVVLTASQLEAKVELRLEMKAGRARIEVDGFGSSHPQYTFVRRPGDEKWASVSYFRIGGANTFSVPAGPCDVLFLLQGFEQAALLRDVHVPEGETLRRTIAPRRTRMFRVPESPFNGEAARVWIESEAGLAFPLYWGTMRGHAVTGWKWIDPSRVPPKRQDVGPLPLEEAWLCWRLEDGATGRVALEAVEK